MTRKEPGPKEDNRRMVLQGLVRADAIVQIALAMPLSAILGWALGDFFARRFHQEWMAVAGLFLGIAAGFAQVIRLANQANRINH
jgi:ATP synthase protein I